ncbi:MAG: FecR domain-containing protein [Prevotellaceae bacterium]|jgi:ferric-dicitrate binding protein FerR (iron transport regulator)|nr:FecR domain-containing protein [Prevotellaceae bacterium]
MTNRNNSDNNRIRHLILRYLNDSCTPDEENELAGSISALSDDELFAEIEKSWKNFKPSTVLSRDKSLSILNGILKDERGNRLPIRKPLNKRAIAYSVAVAASVAILFTLGLLFGNDENKQVVHTQSIIVEAVEVAPAAPVNYIRNIILPDSSKVILQGESTIRYLNDFSGATREISLEGQAYFDIRHNPGKPFIIRTGAIKTTVLGTSFNIKALSGEDVTVSVTRGKVRVEDKNRILAILTVNQELHYIPANTDEKNIPAPVEKTVTDWTKQDLDFDHVSLENVARILCKRYGVNIEISSAELAESEIVSSFGGTESLEDILKVLCAINSQTHFVMKDNNIIISNNEY